MKKKKFNNRNCPICYSSSISSTAQQVHDPEPCGNGWLCGAAMARVNIEAGHLSGLSIGNTGGSISTGTQYSTFFVVPHQVPPMPVKHLLKTMKAHA